MAQVDQGAPRAAAFPWALFERALSPQTRKTLWEIIFRPVFPFVNQWMRLGSVSQLDRASASGAKTVSVHRRWPLVFQQVTWPCGSVSIGQQRPRWHYLWHYGRNRGGTV